jgi:hypothetical protein
MLQELALRGVYITEEVSDMSVIVNKPAHKMRSYVIQFEAASNFDIYGEDFQDSVIKWLSFVKQKYQFVDNLELIILGSPYDDSEVFYEAAIDTISNMKNLSSYKNSLYYQLTDRILEVMDDNGLKLKSTEVYLRNDNQAENQF